ncbi:hypothetical protein [Asticcacaulis sp. YBE204]|uniref:hypothetical protein n=1 Tax=Asticcacaulis sp. YBE204 TaxID=1282363 RepID=UPI0003C3F7F5|nr:hypothetical protein [Asticcacaulis sp. YBE204]ESQ78123.1 hypothetical protein AEYBE204_14865 [Asticcacaulis sp. YBE204]
MTKMKLIGAVAVIASALTAGSALAECTDAQTVAIGKSAAKLAAAEASKDASIQKDRLVKVYDCEAEGTSASAEFAYAYVSNNVLKTVYGRIETTDGKVSTFEMEKFSTVATREDTYEETQYGSFSIN